MYQILVKYEYSFRRAEQILYLPRIPVKDDYIILDIGTYKVMEVRLYTFTNDVPNYPGLLASIRLGDA